LETPVGFTSMEDLEDLTSTEALMESLTLQKLK